MASLRDVAIQWYLKVFGAPAGSDIRDEGLETVLDGNSAVALAEAAIASHAVLGGSPPSAGADLAWLAEIGRGGTTLSGESLVADTAEGPRGIVAAATGLALAGQRATAFLSGPDIAAAQDLLIAAAGRHAPLVLHLATRAAAAHGGSQGSAHDTVHLSADSGCFVLFARNVQQAVDFSFIARRVAEETLVPGLVVMDGEQTALAAQDVCLLSPNQASRFLGAPRDEIEAPTVAQKLLFGDVRRRLPIWHDLDEPLLTGAVFDDRSFALGAAARRPFFDSFVSESLQRAFADFARKTGRTHDTMSLHHVDDAKLVLVVQGAAVETAGLAANVLRKEHKLRAGVVGLNVLRPFPRAALAAALAGAERVIVMERSDAALSAEPPLTREVRASLYGASRQPACRTAVYGIGGLPLHLNDLIMLCKDADVSTADPVFLGIAFDDTSSDQPKREVLLDALRRAYPGVAGLGIRALNSDPAPRQKDTIVIAVSGKDRDSRLVGSAAALLRAIEDGRVRTRVGSRADWLVHGGDALLDPGGDVEADVVLDGARRTITIKDKCYRVADRNTETLLGGLFRALVESGLLHAKARRIVSARRGLLRALDAEARDAVAAAFEAGFESLTEQEAAVDAGPRGNGASAPPAVRELGRNDDRVASLPRFWDQTGVLYRDGKTDHLTADPFIATGSMPPLSATFSHAGSSREWLPTFDPAACTGCGKCWMHCPDSAIGVAALGPAALIDAGIRMTGAEAVRQVAGKLAARIISSNKKAESPPPTFGAMLDDAFAWLMDKAPLPDDRRQAIEDGVEQIGAAIGTLPVAVTQPFFHDAEAQQKDAAELLSIVVNADACQSCGLCVAACEPCALQVRETDAGWLEETRALWETWSATPDTEGTSIERAAEHKDVGPTAAMMLSRYCQLAMAGGDVGEAGSGEKMAVRLALAATEYHQQPVVQRFANGLAGAGEELTAVVRDTLSQILPVEDLDAISEQLESLASPRVDLSALAERIAGAGADHSIETAYLLRLIELSNDVAKAHYRLTKGAHGLGRARYGLAISGGTTTAWAARFPANPFQVPTVVDMSGDAAQLAAGLVEGHLDETTELVRLLRLARLEVERPAGLDWKLEALAKLRWQDFEDDELDLCPPLLLVGSDDMLAGRGLAQLVWLLNSGLPVKVLLLSSLELGLAGAATNNPRAGVGLLALAQRNAFVAQSSISFPDHLGDSISKALTFRGPALIQVYAPSPVRDGFAADGAIEQARLAVATRVLPLFCYDPRAEGVFGSRISLDGNPDDDELTAADWLRGQRRFAPYLDSPAFERAVAHCDHAWQTLQELAGDVTPFTEKVAAQIRAEVAADHETELEEQRQAAATELAEVRDKTRADIAGKLRSRLLELAMRRRGG